MATNKLPYKEAKAVSEHHQRRIKSKKIEIDRHKRELVQMYNGIYDTPTSVYEQQLYAKQAYIMCESPLAASAKCGVPVAQIQLWANKLGWEQDKVDYWDKVEMLSDKTRNETIAERQARIITGLEERILELVEQEVFDDDITQLDRAKALDTLIRARNSFSSNDPKDEQPAIPGLSAKANQIFMQINTGQHVPIEEDEEVIDALEALEVEDERE